MATMRCSVLIIGSLLWETGERGPWREERLDLAAAEQVEAPIRYGRRSAKRGHTFTMVFDTDAEMGRAVLVPCLRPVETTADLVDEANSLWRAERNGTPGDGVCSDWGSVGAMFTAGRRDDVGADWGAHYRRSCRPTNPVDEEGLLRIPWPTRVADGVAVTADIVLGAATRSETSRPSPEAIADAWIGQSDGHERYFFSNLRHGIRTTDDTEIAVRILERSPPWIADHDRTTLQRLASGG